MEAWDGSPTERRLMPPTSNFWTELSQEECDRISELAVSGSRDVYGVQHPVFLAPDQLAEVLQPQPARRSRRRRRPPAARLDGRPQ